MRMEKEKTCLTEMGKVIIAEISGFFTISLVITRQLLHTPAHATTFFLGGHVSSDASIRRRTSRRSSCGMLAQQLCRKLSPTATFSSFSAATTTLWDLDLMSSIMLRIIAIPRSPILISVPPKDEKFHL